MERTQSTKRRILVCGVAELRDGEAIRIPEEETGTADAIAVFNDDGHFYALNDTCPHAQAALSEGWVEDGAVECPVHGAMFDLRTGEVVAPPATEDAETHEIEIRYGSVWLVQEVDQDR